MDNNIKEIELRMCRLTQSNENTAMVQNIFDKAPQYFYAIQGKIAGENEATDALNALPPNTSIDQKYNIGFFLGPKLIGYADVINGYPDESFAYLGLLLFSEEYQQKGFGLSAFRMIEQIVKLWPKVQKLRLGVVDTNDVSGFWKKMGFIPTGRVLPCHQEVIKAQIIEFDKNIIRYSFQNVQEIKGPRLTLSPLRDQDLIPLAKVLINPTTWFSKTRDLNSDSKFITYFKPMIDKPKNGDGLTFVVRENVTGEILGMSTFQFPSAGYRKIEIGFTWIADKWHRTYVNTEMKYLMLTHAFEVMGTNRVEFSVHPNNQKSNDAIKRIGATFEGTLRKWRFLPGLVPDDGNRNIYSIIDDEWNAVKARLESLMRQG